MTVIGWLVKGMCMHVIRFLFVIALRWRNPSGKLQVQWRFKAMAKNLLLWVLHRLNSSINGAAISFGIFGPVIFELRI